MRIHHLNCTTMCPFGGFLLDGRSHSLGRAKLVCHCLLLETDRDGLVLVDTGFGLHDCATPKGRLSSAMVRVLRPRLEESETAVRQIEQLGFTASDVRHIVLTHLDFDHAGGLDDFPRARVHVMEKERRVAEAQGSALDRRRFRPEQWRSRSRWVSYVPAGERWYGFECVRPLRDLTDDVLLVPLAGHTLGHAGVAVQVGSRWLLHAGDAYFFREEMSRRGHRCPPGLRAYQTLMEQDRTERLHNQHRLRQLSREHGERVQIFCAHDPTELEMLRTLHRPAPIGEREPPRSVPPPSSFA